MSTPSVDLVRGARLLRTRTPIPLLVSFDASDPSGIAATRLQHRLGTQAFRNLKLGTATATRARLQVGTTSRLVHRFRARAFDAAPTPNASPWRVSPALRVVVRQDRTRAVKQRGTWRTKRARTFFGRTVRATTRRGATQKLTLVASDLAIVSTMGPNRGKAKVIIDGRRVATVDLYARKTKTRKVVYAVSFPSAAKHTIVWKATGTKNRKSKGKRVDFDAFLALR